MHIALLGTLLLTALASATSLLAQGWPQRTVKLVLPLGPGSGADIGARLLSERLDKRWGQAVVVENRPGGDGVVAITTVLNANDDHTLLFSPSSSFVAHPYLHAKLPYDASQIIPIARVSNTVVLIAASAASGITSLAELEAAVKKEPGKLNWATATGLSDFQFQAFLKQGGMSMGRVPYRDSVQAGSDLAEGRIQLYSSAFAIVRPHVEAGKIRVIGVINTVRADVLKGVPTVREAGYPMLEFDGLIGFFGTPAVSVAVREKIAAEVVEVLKDRTVVDRLTLSGQIVNPGTAAQFAAAIEQQRKSAAETALVLGLKKAE